jgi:hypothetical protein
MAANTAPAGHRRPTASGPAKCRDGRGFLIGPGVARSPGDPPETDQPDTAQPAFTHDNADSRE